MRSPSWGSVSGRCCVRPSSGTLCRDRNGAGGGCGGAAGGGDLSAPDRARGPPRSRDPVLGHPRARRGPGRCGTRRVGLRRAGRSPAHRSSSRCSGGGRRHTAVMCCAGVSAGGPSGIVPGQMVARSDRRVMIPSLARVALVPAAALAVHQLRYWLAFGSNASSELARQGHSYLHSVVPWIVLSDRDLGGRVPARPGPCSRWAIARSRVTPFRSPRCGWYARLVWWGSTSRRSFSRVCSRPDIPAAWPASSATAAGGRCRRRWRLGWCWPRCSTVRAGCFESWLCDTATARERDGAQPVSGCRAMCFRRGPRRLRPGGRAAARLAEPGARASAAGVSVVVAGVAR